MLLLAVVSTLFIAHADYRISLKSVGIGVSSERVLVAHRNSQALYEHNFKTTRNRLILRKGVYQMFSMERDFYLLTDHEIYVSTPGESIKSIFRGEGYVGLAVLKSGLLINKVLPEPQEIRFIDVEGVTKWKHETDELFVGVERDVVFFLQKLSNRNSDYGLSARSLKDGALLWRHAYVFASDDCPSTAPQRNLAYRGELLLGTENAIHRFSIKDGTPIPAVPIKLSQPITLGVSADGRIFVFGCHTGESTALYELVTGNLKTIRQYPRGQCFASIEAFGDDLLLASQGSTCVQANTGAVLWEVPLEYKGGGPSNAVFIADKKDSLDVLKIDFILGRTNVIFSFPASSFLPRPSREQ